jgi:non-ribosomal peptide synthetase-like protein
VGLYAVSALFLSLLPAASVAAALGLGGRGMLHATSAGEAARRAVAEVPVVALASFALYALLVIIFTRLLGLRLREGHHAVRSRIGWQVWATERLIDEARTFLFPLYASMLTPLWLRSLGTKVGRGVEASTVLLLPKMTTIGDEAFVADDTLIGSYELGGGWLRIARVKVGKRAFLGNSSMTAPGRRLPKRGLVAVLSATPERAKPGTSWLGSPPVELRRAARDTDGGRTYAPATRLKVARAICELGRLIALVVTFALGAAVVLVLEQLLTRHGLGPTALLGGPVVLVAALAAGLVATLAKWLLVGRVRASEHPLWSSFVWRNEVADTFVEMVAAPWLLLPTSGTPVLTVWLRSVGARIGRGVWCESHWLPEPDLVTLGAGATVNRGCVVQTHLFHDRIMSLDRVTLAEGSTLGPHGVILPAASLGASTTVGPSSLVMRGDTVPAASRWTGNPIAPWAPARARRP